MGYNFKGAIKNAKVTQRGEYFLPGNYRVSIDLTKSIQTEDGKTAYVVETTVLESDNTDIKVGAKRNWFQMITGIKSAFGNIKNFVASVEGIDLRKSESDSETDEYLEERAGASTEEPGELYTGKEVLLTVKLGKTKEKGNDFSFHTWIPTPEAVAEATAA